MEHEQTGPDDEKRSTTSTPNDNEGASKNEDDVRRQDEAAKHIQRVWKQRKKTFMNTDVRWDDAATHTKMKVRRACILPDVPAYPDSAGRLTGTVKTRERTIPVHGGSAPNSLRAASKTETRCSVVLVYTMMVP